jgi:hypothetical protein
MARSKGIRRNITGTRNVRKRKRKSGEHTALQRRIRAMRKRKQPGENELIFQTRRLRRDLHTRLHVLKAHLNGQLREGEPQITLDEVLNHVLEAGLNQTEKGAA